MSRRLTRAVALLAALRPVSANGVFDKGSEVILYANKVQRQTKQHAHGHALDCPPYTTGGAVC